MTASTKRRSGRSISTTAAPCRRWSISPIAGTVSSPASYRRLRPCRWSAADAASRAPTSPMFRTRSPTSASWACAIAPSKSWRAGPLLAAGRAVGEDGPGDEAQLVACLLDREAKALTQHDPALGGERHRQRIKRALARLGRQRRQLVVEPVRKLHAVGGVHLHHHVRRVG